MKLILQDKEHTCLSTCLAMILDEEPKDLWDLMFSNPDEGHHLQEIVDVCVGIGLRPVLIERVVMYDPPGGRLDIDHEKRFRSYLSEFVGILLTADHALAWDGERCFDPNGVVLDKVPDEVDSFLAVREV